MSAAASWSAVLLVLLGVICLATRAGGHGILTEPKARNFLAWTQYNHYWPDGASAGGYKVVGANGAVKWPYGKHSICGDDANKSDQPFMKPGPIVATYKEGQTLELQVLLTTNHYGRFEFRLCPADATKDSQCRKLQRADGKGVAWDLPKVAQGSRFNGGALGENLRPMEVDNFYSWHPMQQPQCASHAHCSRFNGMPVYKLRYKLPQGFKCERCILQWYYLTGHKCHPPCLQSDRYYPDCRSNPKFRGTYLAQMDYCGTEWSAYPEEFWNCADIKIQ
ncbi:hypothetical protein OEZ85_001692 [Tetradesmus obliquus]|uniref:Chitin-binding type-4 domain-containing protein n=1 Tax=Tetradesmus obliquus TaxID=3088 RepID=A0ABY8U0T7_TETOB|nr:hypothetical protein OEZ85_001692 [Tetradesmus obliquus]